MRLLADCILILLRLNKLGYLLHLFIGGQHLRVVILNLLHMLLLQLLCVLQLHVRLSYFASDLTKLILVDISPVFAPLYQSLLVFAYFLIGLILLEQLEKALLFVLQFVFHLS